MSQTVSSMSTLYPLVAGLLLTLHVTTAAGQEPTQPIISGNDTKIVIGRVSEDPKKHFPRLEKMAAYLSSRITGFGNVEGQVIVSNDNQQMVDYLRDNKVDIISETPFSALHFVEETGAEILLREWKKGVAEYHTVFFTRKDSGITALDDLVGKKIAFEDPGSTSAFLVPLAILRQRGIQLTKLSSARETPPSDKIGYAFASGELNIVTWVAKGLADAGAFSNLDWDELVRTPEKIKKDLVIFFTSKPIIRSLILVRQDMQPELKRQIKNILLNMHTDEEGKKVLEAYNKVSRYDEIKGEAKRSLEDIRLLLDRIRPEIE